MMLRTLQNFAASSLGRETLLILNQINGDVIQLDGSLGNPAGSFGLPSSGFSGVGAGGSL